MVATTTALLPDISRPGHVYGDHAMYIWQEKPMQDGDIFEDSLDADVSAAAAEQGGQQENPGVEVPMEDILLIRMGERPLLIRAHDISEIVRPITLTPVPMAPDHLLGLANIHGQIVCIVDPCSVLHLASDRHPLSAHTRYLILRHPRMHVGIWVEEVASIFRVPVSDVPAKNADDDQENLVQGSMSFEQGQFDLLNVQALFH